MHRLGEIVNEWTAADLEMLGYIDKSSLESDKSSRCLRTGGEPPAQGKLANRGDSGQSSENHPLGNCPVQPPWVSVKRLEGLLHRDTGLLKPLGWLYQWLSFNTWFHQTCSFENIQISAAYVVLHTGAEAIDDINSESPCS
jgi:hypothetical protein